MTGSIHKASIETLSASAISSLKGHEKTNLFSQHREVERALELIEAGHHQASIGHLLTALREKPEDIDALDLLAQSYLAAGRSNDAANALRRKVMVHLKRREKDLATLTYYKMVEAHRDIDLISQRIPVDRSGFGPRGSL